jgi:CelD/BcsL family acetyltransferase involved in cellulose biosynthesis
LSSDSSGSPGWVRRRVAWNVRLGEVSLFTAWFEMLQRDAHFTELDPRTTDPELPEIAAGSGLAGAVIRSHPIQTPPPRFKRRGRYLCYCTSRYRRYWIEFQGTFQDYMKKFSGKTRSTLSRKVRRFREAAGTEAVFREFRRPEEIEEFFRLARSVSEKTYQERLLHSGLPSTDVFRAGLMEMARHGRVRGYILSLHDRPVAYLYCPMYRDSGILFYSHLGYDPEVEHLSPGTVLQYLALERLFETGGVKLFDFLEGETAQKELFSTGSTLCADLFYFRLTPRNAALVFIRYATDGLSTGLVRLFDALGIKRALKRLFRRGSAPAASR